jgi:hypothetical protein
MAFGSKNKKEKGTVVKSQPSFKERLSGVKSMFKKAYEDAAKLNDEMQTEKDRKLAQILAINIQVTEIEVTQKETQEFMKNLEKFI